MQKIVNRLNTDVTYESTRIATITTHIVEIEPMKMLLDAN